MTETSKQTFDNAVMALFERYPSAIIHGRSVDAHVCCRLHGPSLSVVGDGEGVKLDGGGCSEMRIGTHEAIRAFHERGVTVCHVSEGQRVVDRKLGEGVLEGVVEGGFWEWAWQRTHGFQRKFMRCNFAKDSLYGAGYCYLRLFEPTVKSRVARILGPQPLLSDVLRLFLAVGHPGGKRIAFTDLGGGRFHVVNSRHMMGFQRIVNACLHLLSGNSEATLGGVVQSKVQGGDAVMMAEDVDETGEVGVHSSWGVARGEGVFPRMGVSASDRALLGPGRAVQLRGWMAAVGVPSDGILDDELLVVTAAPNCVTGGGAVHQKRYVKMLAVTGDVVLKLLASLTIGSLGGAAADYSNIVAGHSNTNLAALLHESGLRAMCLTTGLDVVSKTNATILEALVGLVADKQGLWAARSLARALGVSIGVPTLSRVVAESEGFVGLNSGQYARALQLAAAGQL